MSDRMQVVLATRNLGKAREFGRLLGDAFIIEVLPEGIELPPEDGLTFRENARKKAEAVYAALGGKKAVLADDSGLEVDALGGQPGVRSARFAGDGASDKDNVDKLLREMVGRTDRSARFVCALCLVLPPEEGDESPTGLVVEASGVCTGTLTERPRGGQGFGYDPIFVPGGWELTLAEASSEQKDAVSHRGAAVRALLASLRQKGLMRSGS